MCELTEIMRQKGDQKFIEILNNIRIGKVVDANVQLLAKCKTDINKLKADTTLLFAENSLKGSHNLKNLANIQYPLLEIMAIDKFPAVVPPDLLKKFQECTQNKTGGLAMNLRIKKDARVMLTSNLDIRDRLINGQLWKVFDFQYSEGTITKIYIKFDDDNAGIIKRDKDNFAKINAVVPLERIE